MKKTLTTGAIAKHCDVNLKTVQRWIKRGQLTAFQLPGRGDNRVEVDEFIRFLSKNNMPIPHEFEKRSIRVLIVDDDELMAKSIHRLLTRNEMSCKTASDGFSAGIILGTYKPDIITLDMNMPGISGIEVIKLVRSIPHIQNTKILVLSAAQQSVLDEALENGADDILKKPYSIEELIQKVNSLTGDWYE